MLTRFLDEEIADLHGGLPCLGFKVLRPFAVAVEVVSHHSGVFFFGEGEELIGVDIQIESLYHGHRRDSVSESFSATRLIGSGVIST